MKKVRYYDSHGLYITATQLRFYINDPKGFQSFRNYDDEFKKYFNECRTYNLISDFADKDPNCAQFFWDEVFGDVSIAFPEGGKVIKALDSLEEKNEKLL